MRFLADENIPGPLVEELRARDHDVVSVAESMPGASDEAVLNRALVEGRVIMTLDKEFAAIVMRDRRRVPGIVLVRVRVAGLALFVRTVVTVLESRDDWLGHMSVVEARGVRMRKLGRAHPRGGGRPRTT